MRGGGGWKEQEELFFFFLIAGKGDRKIWGLTKTRSILERNESLERRREGEKKRN